MTTFTTTITQKRQVTLGKELMEALQLRIGERIDISLMDKKKKIVQIEPLPNLMDLAGKFKVKGSFDPVPVRAYMEKHYERI